MLKIIRILICLLSFTLITASCRNTAINNTSSNSISDNSTSDNSTSDSSTSDSSISDTSVVMISFSADSKECRINEGNKTTKIDIAEAVSINGAKTYLPLKVVLETLKGNMTYNRESKKANASLSTNTYEFIMGKPEIKLNGELKPLDPQDKNAAPYVSEAGNIMVPVAFFRFYTDLEVYYNKDKNTISIRNMPATNTKQTNAKPTNASDISKKLVSTDFEDLIPITEMGNSKYKGYAGGLYPGSLNTPPETYLQEGMKYSNQIVPLNRDGKVDENGKIVLLSIGMSNTTMEFSAFKKLADSEKQKNPSLVIVDGAQGGQDAKIISDPGARFWTIIEDRLKAGNVSNKQVQAIWLKEAVADENKAFPTNAQALKDYMTKIVSIIKQRYPNTQIIYTSSRTYGGYATTRLNPEPFAYEGAFSVKWLIEDRINGKLAESTPWLAWGPYLWTNGTKGRGDGFLWDKDDVIEKDGTHPSTSGNKKVAEMLLNFFKADPTSKQWFLKK